MPALKPAPQQQDFLNLLTNQVPAHLCNRHLALIARAGTGKTTTIMMGVDAYAALYPSHQIAVVAYNVDITREIDSKLKEAGYDWRQVQARTAHGFGNYLLKNTFRPEIEEKKVWKLIDAKRENLPRTSPFWAYGSQIQQLVSLGKQAGVGFFDHLHIEDRSAWYQIADHFDIAGFDSSVNIDEVVTGAITIYKESLAITDTIDFDDMILMPLVYGARVKYPFDLVFVDERQDLSAARHALVKKLLKPDTGRMVIVGDPRQCHPPGTLIEQEKGKPVSIESLRNGSTVRGWNRNAQKMIAGREIKIAVRPYTDTMITVTCEHEHRSTRMTPNHRLLCRWSDRSSEVCVTYLMWREGFGFRVGWCKLFANGKTAQLTSRCLHLAHRARIEKADKCWILEAHETRTQASMYESIVAARYGLPTITFEPVNGATHLTTETIGAIFADLKNENEGRGFRCLHDHGREFGLQFYPWIGMGAGSGQGRRTYFEVYAANLVPSLLSVPLPDSPNLWTKVEAVTRKLYSGPVYSLDVEEDHSYSADGIVVLNSIYGFSGAETRGMEDCIEEMDMVSCPLSVTWRCARAIVSQAQTIVPDLEAAPNAAEGEVLSQPVLLSSADYEQTYGAAPSTTIMLDDLQPGKDAILCRNNAPLAPLAYKLIRAGVPAKILGRKIGEGLITLCERWDVRKTEALVNKLLDYRERETSKLKLKGQDVKAEEVGDRVGTLLEIVQEVNRRGHYTVDAVVRFVRDLFSDETRGFVTLSTYHKSKGKEWDRVFLFEHTSRCPSRAARQAWQLEQEMNISYVSFTRAKRTLVFVG
jgi:hypothetical protein